jgi:DNA repair exonuclease SbcCD ATPase subunit
MDETKTIYTDDNTPIPWLEKSVDNFLDKTTLVFGGTGSGKTTIIEEILYLCRNYIPNYFVIAPRTSDKAYRKKIPARCIREDLTKKKLQKIWDRQFFFTQLYNIANDITVLESLFNKTPDKQAMVMVKAIIQRAKDCIDNIEQSSSLNFAQKTSQKNIVEELMNKKIKSLYKKTIRQYRSVLEKYELEDKEKIALEYLDINPRIMMIIDDSSEKFKGWMKFFKKGETNPFECIFYKSRWNFITLVFAAHDDKIVDTELRKNARVTIFTNSQALVASLNKTQSGYTSSEKKLAMKMAGKLFGGEDQGIKTHQKFCYIREDSHPFRYTIANLYPEFTLGCQPLQELIQKMPKLDDNLENNPFLKDIIDDRVSNKMQKRRNNPKYD